MDINIMAGINKTSYGYHACYSIKYLKKLGHDIRVLPIGGYDPDSSFSIPTGNFHHKATALKIWHGNSLSGMTGYPRIGFSAFELEDLSDIEIHNMKYMDRFITPTQWGSDICSNHGISSSVVPLGYDNEIFRPVDVLPSDSTVFGNFGKWEIRKGHDVLIKAFNAAFEKDDEVTLVMMPTNGFLNSEQVRAWQRMYLESKLGDKVQIVPRVNTHQDVFNIMRQVDCAIFPARAEGWNMEALEMMGCGKEVIITNCTGHTGFVNESCRLVDMKEEFETAYDGVFFGGFSKWRKFTKDSFDQLVEHMRNVHRGRANLQLNQAAVNRAKEFTWEKSTNVLEKEIKATTE